MGFLFQESINFSSSPLFVFFLKTELGNLKKKGKRNFREKTSKYQFFSETGKYTYLKSRSRQAGFMLVKNAVAHVAGSRSAFKISLVYFLSKKRSDRRRLLKHNRIQ